MTGFLNSATTSRMISMDSASSRLRCLGRVSLAAAEVMFAVLIGSRSNRDDRQKFSL